MHVLSVRACACACVRASSVCVCVCVCVSMCACVRAFCLYTCVCVRMHMANHSHKSVGFSNRVGRMQRRRRHIVLNEIVSMEMNTLRNRVKTWPSENVTISDFDCKTLLLNSFASRSSGHVFSGHDFTTISYSCSRLRSAQHASAEFLFSANS